MCYEIIITAEIFPRLIKQSDRRSPKLTKLRHEIRRVEEECMATNSQSSNFEVILPTKRTFKFRKVKVVEISKLPAYSETKCKHWTINKHERTGLDIRTFKMNSTRARKNRGVTSSWSVKKSRNQLASVTVCKLRHIFVIYIHSALKFPRICPLLQLYY